MRLRKRLRCSSLEMWEKELENAGSVAVQVIFHPDNGAVAVQPEALPGRGFGGEPLCAQDLRVNAHDEDILVIGAIEDADAAALGQTNAWCARGNRDRAPRRSDA